MEEEMLDNIENSIEKESENNLDVVQDLIEIALGEIRRKYKMEEEILDNIEDSIKEELENNLDNIQDIIRKIKKDNISGVIVKSAFDHALNFAKDCDYAVLYYIKHSFLKDPCNELNGFIDYQELTSDKFLGDYFKKIIEDIPYLIWNDDPYEEFRGLDLLTSEGSLWFNVWYRTLLYFYNKVNNKNAKVSSTNNDKNNNIVN